MKQKYQILFFAFMLILARVLGGKIKGDTMMLVSSLIPYSLGKVFIFHTLGGVKYLILANNAVVAAHELGHITLHREGVGQFTRSLSNEVFCDLHAVKHSGQIAVLHMLNNLILELQNKADGIRKYAVLFGTGGFGKRYESLMEDYASVVDKGIDELIQRKKFIVALAVKGDEIIAMQFTACFPKRVLRHLV